MAYEVIVDTEVGNFFNKTKHTIQMITINDNCIEVGSYKIPLNHIILIKDIGE